MKLILIGISALLISGCAAGKLLPDTERKSQYVHETNVRKEKAYNKALEFLAQNLGDSLSAIKVKNKKTGNLIAKGNITCNVLRQTGDINDYFVSFDLNFKAKDKKVRYQFNDIMMVGSSGAHLGWSYLQVTSKENLNKVNSCLASLSERITKTINQNDDF